MRRSQLHHHAPHTIWSFQDDQINKGSDARQDQDANDSVALVDADFVINTVHGHDLHQVDYDLNIRVSFHMDLYCNG